MVNRLEPLIVNGSISTVYINIEEDGRVIEQFGFDLDVNLGTRPNRDILSEVSKKGLAHVVQQFMSGENGAKDIENFYSSVTQHLIRLIQVQLD